MKKLFIGFFGACCLLATSSAAWATGILAAALAGNTVLNDQCFAQCLKDSQVDQCKAGDALTCSAKCQRVPEIPFYYNGVVIKEEIRETDKGEVYIAPPALVACELCAEDNNDSKMSCGVAITDSSNNICSSVLGLTTATATVQPFDLALVRLGAIKFGESFTPCEPTTGPTGVAYAGYPKCASSIDVPMPALFGGGNGFGCYETRPPIWSAQGCPAAARCCTLNAGCTVPDTTEPINNNIQGDGKY